MNPYLPLTEEQRKEMLTVLGIESVDKLLSDVFGTGNTSCSFNIPAGLSEHEVRNKLATLAAKNIDSEKVVSLLGAGCYSHYVPAAVRHIASRAEFYTAYTPYQPEISQGTLQIIFEFQTMICEITGTDVSNASLYDGATALAEGVSMAKSIASGKGNKILICRNTNPRYRQILNTYAKGRGFEIVEIDYSPSGHWPKPDDFLTKGNDVFAVVIQQPDYFGLWEDLPAFIKTAKDKNVPVVVIIDLLSCALAEPPGNLGADIVVGEAQGFGNAMGFGGPHLGFIAAQRKFIRQMPGRIVGETLDTEGKCGFVLTAQTREQHIRREKATSNICSNQALNALCAVVHLALLGKEGFVKMAELCSINAHEIYENLIKLNAKPVFQQPFFREFVVKVDEKWLKRIDESGKIFFGVPLDQYYDGLKGCRLISAVEHTTWDCVEKVIVKN